MKNKECIKVGHIVLGNTVDVTDPCYDKDVWCRATLQDIVPGKYKCEAIIADEGKWGKRVSKARIVLDDGSDLAKIAKKRAERARQYEHVANIGVDAGLAGFFANKPDFDDDQWDELCEWMFEGDISEKNYYIKRFDNNTDGFWTSSGYGDGSYDVFAIYENVDNSPKVVALEIRFL